MNKFLVFAVLVMAIGLLFSCTSDIESAENILGKTDSSSSVGLSGFSSSSSSLPMDSSSSSLAEDSNNSSSSYSVVSSSSVTLSSSSIGGKSSESQEIGRCESGELTDPRDGKKYKCEEDPSNRRIWMSENLNYSRGNTLGWCYNETERTSLGTAGADLLGCSGGYGRAYTWEIAMDGNSQRGICPNGWHIPSLEEWTALGAGTSSSQFGTRRMSSAFYIYSGNYDAAGYEDRIPGWYERGMNGFYWTSNNKRNFVIMGTDNGLIYFNSHSTATNTEYYSIRCVFDNPASSPSSSSVGLSSSSSVMPSSSSVGAFCEDFNQNNGQLCDVRDGQTYAYVTIDNLTWMAKNLNYAASGKCGNTYNTLSDNNTTICDTYGRLYTWAIAKEVCPSGWHLPSKGEWDILLNYAGSSTVAKLKATSWNGTNDYGFSALPGSYGASSGYFNSSEVGNVGYWWSSTLHMNNNAYGLDLREYAGWSEQPNNNMYSVRCVMD